MKQLTLFDLEPLSMEDSNRKSARSSNKQNGARWFVPPDIVVATVELMGAIDLDPNSNSKSLPNVPAKQYFTAEDNGLQRPWGPKRRIFLNPPPSRTTEAWINKVCNEYEAGNISEAVVLVRAEVDSEWWQRLTAYPVCFIHRKLRFGGRGQRVAYALAVAYLGPNLAGFAEAFNELGTIYVPFKRKALPTVPQIKQHGRYILSVNYSACYLTIANPTWDARNLSQDQEWLRRNILDVPGILPSRYSAISKSAEGTAKLVFSFKKGEGESVVRQIEALLEGPRTRPKKPEAPKAARSKPEPAKPAQTKTAKPGKKVAAKGKRR